MGIFIFQYEGEVKFCIISDNKWNALLQLRKNKNFIEILRKNFNLVLEELEESELLRFRKSLGNGEYLYKFLKDYYVEVKEILQLN